IQFLRRFNEFRSEVLLMNGLEHPNLVKLLGMCTQQGAKKPDTAMMLMVTELVPLGDLFNFLQQTRAKQLHKEDDKEKEKGKEKVEENEKGTEEAVIPWPLIIRIATDIALGMNFLHTATPPIVHNDLKSPNILLASSDYNPTVVAKVTDFGLSA